MGCTVAQQGWVTGMGCGFVRAGLPINYRSNSNPKVVCYYNSIRMGCILIGIGCILYTGMMSSPKRWIVAWVEYVKVIYGSVAMKYSFHATHFWIFQIFLQFLSCFHVNHVARPPPELNSCHVFMWTMLPGLHLTSDTLKRIRRQSSQQGGCFFLMHQKFVIRKLTDK